MLRFLYLLQEVSAQMLDVILGYSYAGSGLLQSPKSAAAILVAILLSSLQPWPHRESWNGLVCARMLPTLHPQHLAGGIC